MANRTNPDPWFWETFGTLAPMLRSRDWASPYGAPQPGWRHNALSDMAQAGQAVGQELASIPGDKWAEIVFGLTPMAAGEDVGRGIAGMMQARTWGELLPAAGQAALGVAGVVPVAAPWMRTAGAAQHLADAGLAARTLQVRSKSASLRDPPPQPQRPFAADYPHGARADAQGRLTHDIEGRPLVAERVVGRRVVGGPDEALPQTAEANESLATALTGSVPARVAPRVLRGEAGRYTERWDRVTGERARGISVNRNLSPQAAQRVLNHEIGHAISRMAYLVPTDGIKLELRRVYNDLNGEPWRLAQSARTGQPVPRRYWTGPEHRGYPAREVDGELTAEAIRAYLTDPNYLKTVAPRTAALIRAHVNADPRLSRIVQFNSLLPPAIAFGMLLPAVPDEERRP